MKKRKTPLVQVERSRWLVAAGAAVLLWSTWNYCLGGSMGLFIITAVFAALAVIRKRNLPRQARWVIWTWVFVTVVCLASNVSRLVPGEGEPEQGWLIFDRGATALYSLGLCSLFFLSGRLQVSLIAIVSIPLVMLAFREGNGVGLSPVYEQLVTWLFVILIVALDYTCRCKRPTELSGGFQINLKRGGVRWVWLLLTLCAAYFVSIPVEKVSFKLQQLAYGINFSGPSRRSSPMSAKNGLYLSRSLPEGYSNRMRLLLLIDSRRVPGYLRENVFTKYHNGKWLQPENTGMPVSAVNADPDGRNDEKTFSLTGKSLQGVIDEWVVDVLNPKMLSAVCLPGSAISIYSRDPAPFMNSNGVVTVDEEYSSRYRVGVGEQYKFMSACQKSDGFSDPDYLDVPANLSSIVSNWVADCSGVGGDYSVLESRANIQRYFRSKFLYSNDVRMNRGNDPLVDFMENRKGYCIHFSSAAALMFRSAGIPSRVVVGYVCMELNPWINRYVVREREGHSWVEIWDRQQKKWLLVEPTPPSGIPAYKDRSGIMRLAKDFFVSAWKRFIAWINNVNILQVIASAGIALFIFIKDFMLSPWGAALVIGFILFAWWRRKKMRSILTDEQQLRADLTTLMHKIARRALPSEYQIREAECWDSWLKRVKDHLSAERYAALSETVESYQLLRYSKKLDVGAAERWLAANASGDNNAK